MLRPVNLVRMLVAAVVLAAAIVAVLVLMLSQVGRTSAVDLGDAEPAIGFELVTVASGLVQPTHLTHAGDGSGLLYVVEQGGTIRVLDDGVLLEEPLLDITPMIDRETWEQGLLSVAFHPSFASNRRFFIFYSRVGDAAGVVAEYRLDEEGVARHVTDLFEFDQPAKIHYGGQLVFGPDGMLYISVGDGHQRPERYPVGDILPQRLDRYGGKLLRVDVDGAEPYAVPADNPFVGRDGALPEIWAYGLRNPWRVSFDRETGAIYTGNVGHIAVEAMLRLERGGNYGWPYYEGPDCRVEGWRGRLGCLLAGLRNRFEPPIAFYRHLDATDETEVIAGRDSGKVGGNSITGGYVYRGEAFPSLRGQLFVADFISGHVWSLEPDGDRWRNGGVLESTYLISSFGEDAAGELYLLDWAQGGVLQLVAR